MEHQTCVWAAKMYEPISSYRFVAYIIATNQADAEKKAKRGHPLCIFYGVRKVR